MHNEQKSKILNGRAWTEEDTALLTDLKEDQQEKVKAWIKENFIPNKTPFREYSSYALKHTLQHDIKIYLTNNQFKDAMLMCGFQPINARLLNWYYCISRKSPALKKGHFY